MPDAMNLERKPHAIAVGATIAIMIVTPPRAAIIAPTFLTIVIIRVAVAVCANPQVAGICHIRMRAPAVSCTVANHMGRRGPNESEQAGDGKRRDGNRR